MASIKRFEELECWQTAKKLCNMIYKLTLKDPFSDDFKLVNQIRSSSGSGMNNIAEGFERGGNKEFIQFLFISRGSIGESKSQLYRALDQKYITKEEFNESFETAEIGSKQITKLIGYLSNSVKLGFKSRNHEP